MLTLIRTPHTNLTLTKNKQTNKNRPHNNKNQSKNTSPGNLSLCRASQDGIYPFIFFFKVQISNKSINQLHAQSCTQGGICPSLWGNSVWRWRKEWVHALNCLGQCTCKSTPLCVHEAMGVFYMVHAGWVQMDWLDRIPITEDLARLEQLASSLHKGLAISRRV